MITPYTQSKFIERTLTSDSGERFRVLFLITLVNGEVNVQIISAKPISARPRLAIDSSDADISSKAYPCYYLSACSTKKKHDTLYIPSNAPKVSPYFSLEFLINSQPTRAPSFAR